MYKKINLLIKSAIFEYILLALVLIGGFSIRLYRINNPIADWHSWRQADTASVTKTFLASGINFLMPRYHDISSIQTGVFNPQGYRMVEFPVYNALSAEFYNLYSGISVEVWSRLTTILCALVTAFFLFLIGKKYMGSWGGILSAFFYLFIPYNIYFTRVILPDPMGVTFGVISLWLFIRFIDTDKWFYLLTSSGFFALMMLIKPYFGFFAFPLIYLAVNKFGIKKLLKEKAVIFKAVTFGVISLLPFLLWRVWTAKFPEGIPFYSWAFNGNHIRFKPSFWYWIFGERLGHIILGSLGLIPFIFGVFDTKSKVRFIHWLLGGTLFYVVAVASANVMHDYYQIPVIPGVSLALALGSLYLWNQTVFNKFLARAVLIVSICVMLITGWNQISGNFNVNRPEIIEAGKEVDKITPKDVLVVAPYNGDTAFLYATGRWGWPAVDNSIDTIIERGADYYVSVDLNSADSLNFEKRFKTIEKTNKYLILDLHSEISEK